MAWYITAVAGQLDGRVALRVLRNIEVRMQHSWAQQVPSVRLLPGRSSGHTPAWSCG